MNSGKICVSVCAESETQIIANIKGAERFADVIEIRFDCLSKHVFPMDARVETAAWARLLSATRRPIISAYRPREQGGHQDLTDKERGTFWYAGMETDFCDVEEDLAWDAFSQFFGHRIVSHHDLDGSPKDLDSIFDRLASMFMADTVKIAITAVDITDTIPVWNLLSKAKATGKQMIPIAMGEAGKWTRILGLAHGVFLTYGSLEAGKETAEGQIPAEDLIEVYRVKELDKETKVYGIIGDPVSESLSPFMHNAAFGAAGINAVFVPLLVKNIDAFMTRMVLQGTRELELNFAGFAVTMPHKQAVIRFLDSIDETAEKIGAVNTITIDADGRLHGFNTDAYGFMTPLKQKLGNLHGARVAVLGAGGAARACIHALAEESVDARIFARDEQKAASLASQLGVSSGPISNLKFEILNFDVLVNATPLGMKGPFENESPLTADQLKGVKLVFDLVTSSTDTPLIREAKKAGVATITGVEMLIEQGARQFEIWTGHKAPVEIMRTSILKRINDGG